MLLSRSTSGPYRLLTLRNHCIDDSISMPGKKGNVKRLTPDLFYIALGRHDNHR